MISSDNQEVQTYKNVTLDTWPDRCSREDPQLQNYWQPILAQMSQGKDTIPYISNTHVSNFSLIRIGSAWLPVTQSIPIQLSSHIPYVFRGTRSYCTSLYAHFVFYANDDVNKLIEASEGLKGLRLSWPVIGGLVVSVIVLILRGVIFLQSIVFYICGLDNATLVNNWMLSTNLYPQVS